jgi:hypothetical protein
MSDTLDEVKARLNALIGNGMRIANAEHMKAIVRESQQLGELVARYRQFRHSPRHHHELSEA